MKYETSPKPRAQSINFHNLLKEKKKKNLNPSSAKFMNVWAVKTKVGTRDQPCTMRDPNHCKHYRTQGCSHRSTSLVLSLSILKCPLMALKGSLKKTTSRRSLNVCQSRLFQLAKTMFSLLMPTFTRLRPDCIQVHQNWIRYHELIIQIFSLILRYATLLIRWFLPRNLQQNQSSQTYFTLS